MERNATLNMAAKNQKKIQSSIDEAYVRRLPACAHAQYCSYSDFEKAGF